jgi:hypothetical protein
MGKKIERISRSHLAGFKDVNNIRDHYRMALFLALMNYWLMSISKLSTMQV